MIRNGAKNPVLTKKLLFMTDLQKAFAWFESKGIDAKIHDDAYIVIVCNGYEIEIAEHEIEWRAVMYDLGK